MKQRLRARFRRLTAIQVVMLVLSIALLTWTMTGTNHLAVPIVLAVVILLQVLGLLRFVESHVQTLEEFFAAVNYEDFTRRFVADDLDVELKTAFNHIIEKFQDARAERELQANYLETVVRHVPVPLMAARQDGSLRLVNHPARRLTGLSTLSHIDDLAELDPGLPALIRNIQPGEQQLLQTKLRESPAELRVSVAEIRMGGVVERLYSLENLSGELTERESSAWRNLIRVLTHEIMNTLTPVTSLAETCTTMLDDPGATADIREAVDTIARRSAGLMQFVGKYRELLQVPRPKIETVYISQAMNGVVTLMQDNKLRGIDLSIDVTPDTLDVQADPQLLDQILLNLIKNAADALEHTRSPKIRLTGRLDYGRVLIQVIDNGPGIPDSVRDQIFVPFFTTKRDGSGIGLSLSRQIMTAHGGEIAVNSGDEGTRVSLIF